MRKAVSQTIIDSSILGKRFCERDGFYFTSICYPHNVYDAIILRNPSGANTICPRLGISNESLDSHIAIINKYNLDKALIIADDLRFVNRCPSLKHICIIPSDTATDDLDFSPLYEMPELLSITCKNQYGYNGEFYGSVDYSRINGLVDLGVNVNKRTFNYNLIPNLKTLHVSNHKGKDKDLTDLFCSKGLDTLRLIQCKNTSLKGIGTSSKMQCLYLQYNRFLSDITALYDVKLTLKTLRIENCHQITDFSVLEELVNLEMLELSGNNTLSSLYFLRKMKKLKTFVFSMNVVDGDLSLCKKLSYVLSIKDRRHYNLKDKDLPKDQYYKGNEDIEEWRRLE